MRTFVRVIVAIAAATALAAVFATRVFTSFDAVRVKLVTSSTTPVAGQVRVDTAANPRVQQLRPPFAVIAHLHNQSSSSAIFSIRIDDLDVCGVTVAAGDARRVDCAMSRDRGPTNGHDVVTVDSTAPVWSLDYLELATHHGATGGGIFVLPAKAGAYPRPGWLSTTILWVVFLAVLVLPSTDAVPRVVKLSAASIAFVVTVLFISVVVAPWVSAYRIVVSPGTFVRAAALLVIPQIWATVAWAVRRVSPVWVHVVVSLLVASTVLWAYDAFMMGRLRDFPHDNYSGLLHISRDTFDHNPILAGRDEVRHSLVLQDGGYDGEFMYFAAFDPFLRRFHDEPRRYREFMDAPPYRFGRIGFSLLTKIVSFDRWRLYPASMVWLILTAIAATSIVLSSLARDAGASPAWGLLVLLIPGFWMSVESGLPEPIAAATALGGYWCVTRQRWIAAGALFALSLLVRETGIVLLLCLGASVFRSGQHRRALTMLALALAPVVLWRLYVGWILFPDWRWEGFIFNPHDLGLPFAGFVDLWRAVFSGVYSQELRRAAIVYPLVLTGALVLSIVLAIRKPGAVTLATVCYAAIAVSLNYASIWIHVGNGQRGTFEVFTLLAASSVTLATAPRVLRVLIFSFWAFAGVYMLYGSFDAAFIRGTLF